MESARGDTATVATVADPIGPWPVSSVRASDAERAAAADRLHAALGEGRLDLAETEDRLAAAYAARYRCDLLPLFADLPAPEPPSLRAGWARVWQVIVRQTWMSAARARGIASTDPSKGQQRATSIVLVTVALWMMLCLLVGLAVGLVG
jgi:hypothetical protein